MNEDKAGVISNAVGVAVLELIGERVPINRDSLVDKLEHNRRETGNVIGKARSGMRRSWSEEGYKTRRDGRVMFTADCNFL